MAAGTSPHVAAPEPPPAPAPPPAPRSKPRRDDTAEFKASEIREALRHPPPDLDVAPKPIRAVSASLLTEERPPAASAPARLPGLTADTGTRLAPTPPAAAPLPPPQPPSLPSPSLLASETFRFLEPHVLQVDFAGKIFIKQGTIYSYSGDLTFWVKDRRPGSLPALVIITGRGRLILTERDREITLMHVDDEAIYVEPSHLLACEETLTPRYVRLDESGSGPPEFVQLEGRGIVALSAASRPLALAITPDLPVSVPAHSVIMWSGPLAASTVADREIYEVIQPGAGHPSPLIRLVGRGRLLMEQARSPA
jgi:uncharacterized protein (AIM24 family)